MKDLNWNERFIPRNMADEDDFSIDSISLSVQNKLENEKGHITMTKKRIKPLLIVAAAVATAAVSMISVNAATDGAITDAVENTVSKVKMFINGEEVEADAYLVDSGVDENGNEYSVYRFDVDDDTSMAVAVEEGEGEGTLVQYESDELDLSDGEYYRKDITMEFDGENVEEEQSGVTEAPEE